MIKNERFDICLECKKTTEYKLVKEIITTAYRGKEYDFNVTTARCSECNEIMSPPGIITTNIKEMDEQYRLLEDIVTNDDIEKLMKIYKIEKEPLSLILGFEKTTISRYFNDIVPSKEYSEILKKAISSPNYFLDMLESNKSLVNENTYKKLLEVAKRIKK